MARSFKTVNYEESLKQTVTVAECLPPHHLARFIVMMVALLDVSAIYARYAPVGGAAFAPEVLLGLLFYGYATGVFSSRKIEQATYESIPFRFMAGGLHPDHDTIAHFRKAFLPEFLDLFVQVLVIARETGVLKLGRISLDGSKIHADASKSHAVSYGRLRELENRLRAEVAELVALGEQADQSELPEGLDPIPVNETKPFPDVADLQNCGILMPILPGGTHHGYHKCGFCGGPDWAHLQSGSVRRCVAALD